VLREGSRKKSGISAAGGLRGKGAAPRMLDRAGNYDLLCRLGLARIWLRERDGVFCLVDAEDFLWLQAWRWNVGWFAATPWKYYAKRNTGAERSTVYLAREVMQRADPRDELFCSLHVVDHINGQSLDNRRANLRWATITENRNNRIERSAVPSLDSIIAQLAREAGAQLASVDGLVATF
jgi:hypothetical protein